jgi:hypothetical protein
VQFALTGVPAVYGAAYCARRKHARTARDRSCFEAANDMHDRRDNSSLVDVIALLLIALFAVVTRMPDTNPPKRV